MKYFISKKRRMISKCAWDDDLLIVSVTSRKSGIAETQFEVNENHHSKEEEKNSFITEIPLSKILMIRSFRIMRYISINKHKNI